MKITLPYLRRASLWTLSVMAGFATVFAAIWAVTSWLLWISGGPGLLFWPLLIIAAFIFLMLCYCGADLAFEIMIKKQCQKK